MENYTVKEKIEDLKNEYRQSALDGNWERVNDIGIELQELDMGDLEVELSAELSIEQIEEYKRWDRRVNGDIETQMDDFS